MNDAPAAGGSFVGKPGQKPGRLLGIHAAVFDLDGTLVESAGDILETLRQSLTALGAPFEASAIRSSLIGPPLEAIVDAVAPGLDPGLRARVIQHYRQAYLECGFAKSPLYAGVAENLEKLRSEGICLFVATNKPRAASERLLEARGIRHFFTDTAHGDSLPGQRLTKAGMLNLVARRHKLMPRFCLMQGDAPGDLSAAAATGFMAAAALYGYGERSALMAEKPIILLPNPRWEDGIFREGGEPFRWRGPEGGGQPMR